MITIILSDLSEVQTPAIRKTATWALHCAYHRNAFCEDKYAVTHLPTGKVVGDPINSLEQAQNLFDILQSDFPNYTVSCQPDMLKGAILEFYEDIKSSLQAYEAAKNNPDLWEVMDNDGTLGLLNPNTRMIIWEDGTETESEWEMIFLFMHNIWFRQQEK